MSTSVNIPQVPEKPDPLEAQELRYRRAIGLTGGAVYEHCLVSNRFTYLDPQMADLLGYPLHRITPQLWGEIIMQFIGQGELELLSDKEAFQKLLAGEVNVWKAETEIVTSTGERRWIRDVAITHRDEEGRPIGSTGIMTDITERVLRERAIRERKTRLDLVNRIARNILTHQSIQHIVQEAVQQIASCFPLYRTSYSVVSDEGEITFLASIQPEGMPSLKGLCIPTSRPLQLYTALQAGQSFSLEDVTDLADSDMQKTLRENKTIAFLDMPLWHSEKLVGILCLDYSEPHIWTEHERATLTEVAELLSIALQEAQLREQRELALEQLRESEDRMREARRIGRLGDWECDLEFTKNIWSEETYRIFGRPLNLPPPSGQEYLAMIHPDDRDRLLQAFEEAVLLREQKEIEYRIIRPNGDVRWVFETGEVVGEGEEVRLVGMTQDITRRKRVEIRLALQQSILAMIVGDEPLANILDALVRSIEYQNSHVRGSIMLREGVNGLRVASSPSLPEGFVQMANQITIGPASGTCGVAAYRRERVITEDVDTDPNWIGGREVARTYGIRACWSQPILASGGEVLGTFAMYYREPCVPRFHEVELIETTAQLAGVAIEKRRAEARLRTSQERLQTLFDSLPVVVYTASLDDKNRTTWISESVRDVTGYEVREFLKDNNFWSDRLHPEDYDRLHEDGFLKDFDETFDEEYRWRCADGEYRWFLDKTVRRRVQSDGHGEVIGIWMNIDERKRLEAQFHQSQKMETVGRLAGGIAHDFNNLLTVIIGETDLMQHDPTLSAEARLGLENTRKSADRAAELTRQMLAFARKQVIQPKYIELDGLVQNMSGMLRRLIRENIQLHYSLQTSGHSVYTDPGQIGQVVINLVANARDAMPGGGTLTLATSLATVDAGQQDGDEVLSPGRYVRLTVRDTGTGISPELQKQIFEPFFTTKEVGQGSGLGLSTCYGIAHQNGGFITCESVLREGSAFHLYLPLMATAEQMELEETKVPPLVGKETLLLVEDEDELLKMVARGLRHYGYTVLEASSGEEALQVAKSYPGEISLLFTDMVMPGMNGLALAKALQEMRPELPLVFATGYTTERFSDTDASGRPLRLIHKPYRLNSLMEVIRETLDAS